MRIADVETFVLKIAAQDVYLGDLPDGSPVPVGYQVRPPWRSLYSPRFETLLVKITAEDGTAGWGEALAPVGPEIPAAVVDRLLRPGLIGADANRPRPTWSVLGDLMRERGHLVGHQADALAAVDIALWDLAGHLAQRPIYDLLGGAYRTTIPTYVSGLPRPDDDGRARLAEQWQSRGATAVKLHLGHGVEADIATVRAVHRAAPGLRIAVDGHWAYTLEESILLAEELTALRCWFLEAPMAPEDEDGHAELCARVRIPIAVGEALRNRYEFARWLRARALRIAQPDVARTGITEALSIAELCSAHHVTVAPHHSVGQGIALAAGLHLSGAVRSLNTFEYQPTSTEVGQRILREPILPNPDGFDLPPGPGLGIKVDESAVRQLTEES